METEITKANVRDNVELYTQLRSRVESEGAALALLQEIGKTRRVEMMRARNGSVNGNNFGGNSSQGDQPATTKQLFYLKRLGINPPEGLTKRSASALIDEARENEDE